MIRELDRKDFLPVEKLYKHWNKYTSIPEEFKKDPKANIALDSIEERKFWDFIEERMNIYFKRKQGLPAPWTNDPILQRSRFTNIYRELDWQTQYWHNLLLEYRERDPLFWFLNMAYCRFICKPETVTQVGFLDTNGDNSVQEQTCRDIPKGTFGGSYNFAQMESQLMGYTGRYDTIFQHLPMVIRDCWEVFQSGDNEPIYDMVERMIKAFKGNMRFIWAEIIMDCGYQFPEKVNEMADFFIGPGARPICEKIAEPLPLAYRKDGKLKKTQPKASGNSVAMTLVNKQPLGNFPHLFVNGERILFTTAAIEQALCEYRKYNQFLKDEGRPRIFEPNELPV